MSLFLARSLTHSLSSLCDCDQEAATQTARLERSLLSASEDVCDDPYDDIAVVREKAMTSADRVANCRYECVCMCMCDRVMCFILTIIMILIIILMHLVVVQGNHVVLSQ